MDFNSKISHTIQKYKEFFYDKSPGQILVIISPYTFKIDYSHWGIPDKPMNAWNVEKELDDYVRYNVSKLRRFIEYTKDLDNDYIPSISAALGVGLHSAYLSGADIVIGKETSWVHPVIHDWADGNKLKPDESNRWFAKIMQMTRKISELCEGDYVQGTFAHFAPTDMANALRGNQLFYDFYDYPDEVHKLLQQCADSIIWLEMKLREIVKPAAGGTVTANMWFPGEAPFLSEDAPDLCSAGLYREFGFQYTQKVIDVLGGAYIHHHAKGFHIHNEISRLNNLKTLEISWDPNCPRPIDHLPEMYEQSGDIPLMTRCTAGDVYNKINELKKGRIILMLDVGSLAEAREVVGFIRKHSKT